MVSRLLFPVRLEILIQIPKPPMDKSRQGVGRGRSDFGSRVTYKDVCMHEYMRLYTYIHIYIKYTHACIHVSV